MVSKIKSGKFVYLVREPYGLMVTPEMRKHWAEYRKDEMKKRWIEDHPRWSQLMLCSKLHRTKSELLDFL